MKRLARRAGRGLDWLLPRVRDCVPGLRAVQGARDDGERRDAWSCSNEAPVLRSDWKAVLPGWQMLEIELEHDRPATAVHVQVEDGGALEAERSAYMPLQAGRVTKRIVFLARPWVRVRLEMPNAPDTFCVRRLRLVWLVPAFARQRLLARLASSHPSWRELPFDRIAAHLTERAAAESRPWRRVALEAYDATFAWWPMHYTYGAWCAARAERASGALTHLEVRPTVSVLVIHRAGSVADLEATIDSVVAQHYPNWQLVIECGEADRCRVDQAAVRDERILVWAGGRDESVPGAEAFSRAEGEWIVLLDPGDRLAEGALIAAVEASQRHPEAALLYSDEDKIAADGTRHEPHFKPQWNPDLLLGQNYMGRLLAVRTDVARAVGGLRSGFEGAADYDLALRCSAGLSPDRIVHVPRVLYHRDASRPEPASGGADPGLRAVADHLETHAPDATVEPGPLPHTCRVHWPLPATAPRVTVLIPTRDRVEILRPCVDAILENTDYPDLEVVILDNDSRQRETRAYLDAIAEDPRVRVLPWRGPFNYSAINNFGARHASGDVLALVNNDVEPIHAGWLDEMVRQAVRPEIGCVGAKLYYPDGRIQHAGVVLGIGGVAGHGHRFFPGDDHGYFARLRLAHNVSAVTAACLVVEKRIFDAVGGLEEEGLPVQYNDVDFCLRVREQGYRNLFTPFAELYHHESATRRGDGTPAKRARAQREVRFMRERWGEKLDNDPAYNPNLTLAHEDFSLR